MPMPPVAKLELPFLDVAELGEDVLYAKSDCRAWFQ